MAGNDVTFPSYHFKCYEAKRDVKYIETPMQSIKHNAECAENVSRSLLKVFRAVCLKLTTQYDTVNAVLGRYKGSQGERAGVQVTAGNKFRLSRKALLQEAFPTPQVGEVYRCVNNFPPRPNFRSI